MNTTRDSRGGEPVTAPEAADELALDRLGAGIPLAARGGVERDEIYMGKLAVQ